MYKNGFKTLSHKSLINWLENKYSTITDREIELLDNLRKLRNGSLYYGEKINKLFLENNKDKIENLFKKLLKLIE
jgi:hypothetical protein